MEKIQSKENVKKFGRKSVFYLLVCLISGQVCFLFSRSLHFSILQDKWKETKQYICTSFGVSSLYNHYWFIEGTWCNIFAEIDNVQDIVLQGMKYFQYF